MAKKKKRVVRRKQPQSIVSDEITIPNYSGMHDAGSVHKTPTQDTDIANKKYVDDSFPVTHASTTGRTANDHHAQSHTLASHSTKAHSELTGVTSDLHHAQSHNITSHSDTSATGAELNTLTDNSMANTLHRHSELSASDGSPDPALSVDSAGRVTNPYQPLFQCRITTTETDVTGDGTGYNITGAIWSEVKDQGDVFSNGTFTAPITGTYLLNGTIALDGVLAAHSYGYAILSTSNRNYYTFSANPSTMAGANSLYMPFSLIVDMDVNDTAFLIVRIYYGAKVVDLTSSTWFSGFLIC